MTFKAKNPQITFDLDGNMKISFDVLPESKNCKYEINDIANLEEIEVTAEKAKKRRSLDANACAWTLLGKLAAVLRVGKEEAYRQLIKDIGGNFEVVPIKEEAAERWITNWGKNGVGWIAEILGESKLEGYVNIINYFGSSTFDTRQMGIFIDRIIEDCKLQGIETLPEEKLSLLKNEWR